MPVLNRGSLLKSNYDFIVSATISIALGFVSTVVLATGSGISGNDNYGGSTCAGCHTGSSYAAGNNLAINISGTTNVAVGASLALTLQITNSPADALNGFSATVLKF